MSYSHIPSDYKGTDKVIEKLKYFRSELDKLYQYTASSTSSASPLGVPFFGETKNKIEASSNKLLELMKTGDLGTLLHQMKEKYDAGDIDEESIARIKSTLADVQRNAQLVLDFFLPERLENRTYNPTPKTKENIKEIIAELQNSKDHISSQYKPPQPGMKSLT